MATRDLQVFTNDAFGTIRTVEHEDKVYFCGRDVVTALGYTNTSKAIQDHCRGVPFRYPITDALGRTQEARFITEGDLYRLIFSSKLPAAQDFEAWVVDEVLPTIRRHGVYAIDELLDNDVFLERAIVQLRSERAKRLAAEQALLEVTPKVTYYDIVLQSPDAVPITLIAKDYGLSARKMNQLLHELGIQFKQSGVWVLYQAHAGNGYTDTKTHLVAEGRHTRLHTYWTQKGRLFIYEQLKNQRGILPSIEQDGGAA
ncbi:phage antirepressor [Trueperella pyogenes]|uniref:phage antirepressor n=1 Tax=Trueperella pyogenes TaxID=1661 RepID=UPI00345CF303